MARIDRRDFLKLVGAGGVGVGAGFVLRESIKHPREYLIPHVVAPEDYSTGVDTWYNTVCDMCSAGCGIRVRIREGRAKKIEGNPSHPVNQGRLCALGQAGLQVLYNPDRLTRPLLQSGDRGSDAFVPITWEDGLGRVVERLGSLRTAGRGDRVCLLTRGVRGHLASLFERFMEQLGSPRLVHYDFDFPLTLYEANRRFFGESQLPYYDLEHTRLLLSFGADYLGGWISPVHHGLGFGRSRQGRAGVRGRFVQIEPRMSLSGAAADEWIAARPGTEGVLALGLAHRIVGEGHYRGADAGRWSAALADYPARRVAEQTGVAVATIERLADQLAVTRPSLAIGGGAAANHDNAVDTLVAINALNYLAGNVGREGGVIFNPPPAGPKSPPRQASYRSMTALAEAARQGDIDVLIVNGTNPVFTMPQAARFGEALSRVPLIVSLSSFMDETTVMADMVLPSHSYLESWGDDFPEPGVGFAVGAVAQPVVSPLYDTRATGDIMLALARALDLGEALPWASMKACLEDGWRTLHRRGIPQTGRERFESFWRSLLQAGVWGEPMRRGRDFTLPPRAIEALGVRPAGFSGDADAYPFILHPYPSLALHDGRGANLPWMQELPDPMTSVVYGSWVEMNPATAHELGLSEGDLVDVESPHGRIRAPIYPYPAIMPDVVAMPIGQGHSEYGRYARRGANPIAILSPQVEPHTGALAVAATRVSIKPTGRRVTLVKTAGNSRQLGRGIVQTTGDKGSGGHSAAAGRIPIRTVPS